MAWFTHPLVIQGGIAAAGGLYRMIHPDKQRQLQMDVLKDMRSHQRRLQRMARGNFRGDEREDIRRAAAPGLNRLAGNLAQRGLGTSGAGAQVLADASVRPYTDARTAAEGQLIQHNAAMMDVMSAFPADNSFFDDVGAMVGAYYKYQMLQERGGATPEEDGLVNGFLRSLFQLGSAGGYKK